jgi:hypothetical protein
VEKTLFEFQERKPEDVQYFDEFKGELTHSQRHKADVFLALNLIHYNGMGGFLCLPIPGYNHTTHVMHRKDRGWTCTCQGFRMKQRQFEQGLSPNPPFCSHLLALMHAFKNHQFDGGEHG